MFGKNNDFKINYQNTLKQINELSVNMKNDDDKIRLLGLINNLKYPLDSEILLSIMPCTAYRDDLIRCGIYGAINVENELKFVIISNHT